jgi:hypothetical protein
MPEPDPLEADMMRGAALALRRRADRQAQLAEGNDIRGSRPSSKINIRRSLELWLQRRSLVDRLNVRARHMRDLGRGPIGHDLGISSHHRFFRDVATLLECVVEDVPLRCVGQAPPARRIDDLVEVLLIARTNAEQTIPCVSLSTFESPPANRPSRTKRPRCARSPARVAGMWSRPTATRASLAPRDGTRDPPLTAC